MNVEEFCGRHGINAHGLNGNREHVESIVQDLQHARELEAAPGHLTTVTAGFLRVRACIRAVRLPRGDP